MPQTSRPGASGGAAIDFTTVPHLDYLDRARRVIDGVNDTELSMTNAIAALRPCKFFTTDRPWLEGERSDLADNALAVPLLTRRLDLFLR